MAGLKLYELSSMLTDALAAAEERIDPETGEIPESWASFLDDIQMERDAKLLSCGALYKSWDREAEAIRTEEKALAARRHALEARGERIKAYMIQHIQAGEKLSDSRCVLSWRTSPGAVVVNNPTALPAQYTHTEVVIHKKEIGEALKAGQTVPGAELVKGVSLQIK
jgi:hypothetical protein